MVNACEMTLPGSAEHPQGDIQSVAFSAIVVTYNDGAMLRRCLESVAFCEQIVVVDLGSQDDSVAIARDCGAEVLSHAWVPIVEEVFADAVAATRNPWILRMDPDEVFPADLVNDLVKTIRESNSPAVVAIPYQYYFRGKRLETTIWGGVNYIPRVLHKDRVHLRPHVHSGFVGKEGYRTVRVHATADRAVQHYWADGFVQLFKKHCRYIRKEGQARYHEGQRFSWGQWARQTKYAFERSFIDGNGKRGGLTGLVLSLFYAWYISMSLLSLRRYQKRAEKDRALAETTSNRKNTDR